MIGRLLRAFGAVMSELREMNRTLDKIHDRQIEIRGAPLADT